MKLLNTFINGRWSPPWKYALKYHNHNHKIGQLWATILMGDGEEIFIIQNSGFKMGCVWYDKSYNPNENRV